MAGRGPGGQNEIREYDQVPCPTCGAAVGQCCISGQTGRSLEAFNKEMRRDNYAHIERQRAYKKQNCLPLNHTAWPVGRSPK